jgi:nitrite reductase/ring-hydroxylating ferredoxin subunit
MPDEPLDSSVAEWTRAVEFDRLRPSRPIAVKLRGKHVALFLHQGEVLACNNRCPHEGYPLVEGALDADCVLTCNWHNWKFDLKTGATLYGGDNLRVHRAKVEDGAVWLDTRDPPAAARMENAVGLPDGARVAMLAAVNRLLAVRFKQRHTLRTAHQALGFVEKED